LDEIVIEPNLHFHLPTPESKIVRIITEGLLLNPADPRTLLEWAEHAGASKRSLSRYFRRETGMTFREWRAQLHILEAIARLSQGDRVTDVAYDLGYSNPSSFIALFSKALNVTPGNYLKSLDKKSELSAEIGSYTKVRKF
jgi:AraC-like DNA-binding protein